MKKLTLFKNDTIGVSLSIICNDKDIWFIAKDVAKFLEYSRTADMTKRLDDDEKSTLIEYAKMAYGLESEEYAYFSTNNMTIINESGLYNAVIGSKKQEAKTFKKWITSEVLPSIRKTVTVLETVIFKGNIDGLVWSKDGIPVTTSRIISKIVNKHHKNILRDVRKEINKLQSSNMSHDYKIIIDSFKEIKYISENGQEYKEYEIGELGAMQLLLKYSTEHRAKFVIAFNNLKNAMVSMFKVRLIESVIPQDNRKRQYIYVIHNPLTNNIKIGVAHDVDNRIKQLETGAGVKLDLIYKSIVCSNAFNIEKDVHSKFENNRVFGEWFNISPNEVISFLEQQTFVLKSEFMKELSIFKTVNS